MSDERFGDRIAKIIGEAAKPAMPQQATEPPIKHAPRINITVIAVALILAVASCLGFYFWLSSNRFTMTTNGQGRTYQVDTKTGQAWLLHNELKLPVELEKPFIQRPLPASEIDKLRGTATMGNPEFQRGVLNGRIYNGSSWTISKLVLKVTAKDGGENPRWTRDFSVGVAIPPMSAGTFLVSFAGEDGITDCPWQILEAYGEPK